MSSGLFSLRRIICGVLLLLTSCIDPYLPDSISTTKSYLVVDGFINSQGVTTITLSRTANVRSSEPIPKETNATLYIEQEAGLRYPLQEYTPGTYYSDYLTLTPEANYRLAIITQAGKHYTSAFVPAKITPALDSVSWQAAASGLKIFANTHDAANATRYYRWETEETWEIIPTIIPRLEYVNYRLQPISTPFPIICWGNEKSADIKLFQTTSLAEDVVANFVLRTHAPETDRLHHLYSMLVRQYALTQEEYRYWEQLRKNTENIGTLFDPLPSQLTGNVRCLEDEREPVLGYVGAQTVQQERIFISRNQLPATFRSTSGYEACQQDTVESKNIRSVFLYPGNIPIYEVTGGVLGTTKECVDCRVRGTTTKPEYWP